MSQEFRRLVEATLVLQRDAEQRLATIFDSILNSSPFIDRPNFSAFADEDLAHLFDQYDQRFLQGACRRTLDAMGSPIDFRVSPRMTRAGGKTTRVLPRTPAGVCVWASRKPGTWSMKFGWPARRSRKLSAKSEWTTTA